MMAEVGESVAPIPPGVNISTSSGAIVALADLATLEVEVDVSESNVAKLQADQPAEVSVEAFPDRKYTAVLRQIIPTADRTRATVQVKVTILEKDKDLKPEMSARVTFLELGSGPAPAHDPSAAPVVMVPRAVVATRDGQTVVFAVTEGRAWQRHVVLGLERGGGLVVKEGLTGSETLVTQPPDELRDGASVRIEEWVFLAVVGGVLGCLLAWPAHGIGAATGGANFSEVAFAFRLTPEILLSGLVFAAMMGFVGGLLPALRGARLPVASALREA